MKKITLTDLFSDAPYFRAHEGIIGARYHVKDPNDPNAPGLWFAKEDGQILVARQKPRLKKSTSITIHPDGRVEGDVEEHNVSMGHGSKEATLAQYEFIPTAVEAGDAIYDYHLTFKGSRDGWNWEDKSSGGIAGMFKAERDNGALTQTVIPAEEFHARYDLDEVRHSYFEKPYQKKFITENLMVEMPDGSVEQIAENCEAVLKFDQFSFQHPSINSGFEQRVICGQPLDFYTREALTYLEGQTSRRDVMEHGDHGLGFMGVQAGRPGQKLRNPYGSFFGMYSMAKEAFNKAGMVLSPEQRGEFDRHYDDIAKRYAYFEAHPVVL